MEKTYGFCRTYGSGEKAVNSEIAEWIRKQLAEV